ncbi:MAG: Fic family protein [Promicromonosporaceae bacterium]|nr:Fic family protein [Promicromonosporaceae bacterium]
MPELSPSTFLTVADARASLAALDSTARQLPNPTLLRMPTLLREAQSTSALEGTYAPLAQVLTADEEEPESREMREILNYVQMANLGFDRFTSGWPITTSLVRDLQGALMSGLPLESQSGRFRSSQVVVGRNPDADLGVHPVFAARFIPPPPGVILETGVSEWADWLRADHSGRIDPVVAAAMAHYQFEALHPFPDGNGRLGRFLIVLQFLQSGVLTEPTLSVSDWFEMRRYEYYDRLLEVSSQGYWDPFIRFFARGIMESANATRRQMLLLVSIQERLHEVVRNSKLRSENARDLVDFAIANPSFSVNNVAHELRLSYGRANSLVGQLVELNVLKAVDPEAYKRRFFAPAVLEALVAPRESEPLVR